MGINYSANQQLPAVAAGIPSDAWTPNLSFPADGQAVLKHGNDIILFDLQGASLGYQLEWVPTGAQTPAVRFTKIGPGEYAFQIVGVLGAEATAAVTHAERITTFPKYQIWPGGETQAPQTPTETNSRSVVADLNALKYETVITHQALEIFVARLLSRVDGEVSGVALYDSAEVDLVRNTIIYCHHGLWCVLTSPTGVHESIGSDDLTIVQKINFVQAIRYGPSDITNVADLTKEGRDRTAEEISRNLPRDSSGNLVALPTRSRLWVDPRNGQRVPISEIEDLVGDSSYMRDGVSVDGLQVEDIATQSWNPAGNFFVDLLGGWIANLTHTEPTS